MSTQRDHRRLIPFALSMSAAIALAMSGCAPQAASVAPGAKPEETRAAAPDWPLVDEAGTGSTVITIANPSDEARYLHATFTCNVGSSSVVLVEDPTVGMEGNCGGGQSYQMTLPQGSDEYTIEITLPADSDFTFRGRFATE